MKFAIGFLLYSYMVTLASLFSQPASTCSIRARTRRRASCRSTLWPSNVSYSVSACRTWDSTARRTESASSCFAAALRPTRPLYLQQAKQLDADSVRLAVISHVRHAETDYDTLLGHNVERHDARRRVLAQIEQLLAGWEKSEANVTM